MSTQFTKFKIFTSSIMACLGCSHIISKEKQFYLLYSNVYKSYKSFVIFIRTAHTVLKTNESVGLQSIVLWFHYLGCYLILAFNICHCHVFFHSQCQYFDYNFYIYVHNYFLYYHYISELDLC